MIKDAAQRIAERFKPEQRGLRVIDGEALEIEPTMEDLAQDVERTKRAKEFAIAAHDEAMARWREAKQERGLE